MLRGMFNNQITELLNRNTSQHFHHLHKIGEISLYILSKDNLVKRAGNDETLEMVRQMLVMLTQEVDAGRLVNIVFKFIGALDCLPSDMHVMCDHIQDCSRLGSHSLQEITLCTIAIAYDAVVDCKHDREEGLPAQTPIDVVVRTGGEFRSSGFFPLHTLYSEWIYLPTLFPDLTLHAIDNALCVYMNRQRRYGA